MADINPNDSATLTDGLEIDSYDDVVNLFGADEAAAMLADVVGNRFNRQEILKAIRNCSRTPRSSGPMASSTRIRSRRTRG